MGVEGTDEGWMACFAAYFSILFHREGRYNRVKLYHFHFLAHLTGQIRINTSCFLLESLNYMVARVWATRDPSPHFIYDKDLIKLLIENQIEEYGRIWSHFMFWEGFQPYLAKSKRGREKGAKKEAKQGKNPKTRTSSQGTSTVQTRIRKKVEKTSPSSPKILNFILEGVIGSKNHNKPLLILLRVLLLKTFPLKAYL